MTNPDNQGQGEWDAMLALNRLKGKHEDKMLVAVWIAGNKEMQDKLTAQSQELDQLRAERDEEKRLHELNVQRAGEWAAKAGLAEGKLDQLRREVEGERLEMAAAAVHQAYLDTCARLGWAVKPENQISYDALDEDAKELDRASVRAAWAALTPPQEGRE